jgi:acyl-CoA thioesterase-1
MTGYRLFAAAVLCFAIAAPDVARTQGVTIVALGASNTYGKGVARNQAYPAQLQALLRAQGRSARVVNAGINGDTTGGMLRRLDRVAPRGTRVVILQPGGNDRRRNVAGERAGNIAAIEQRLGARGIRVVMLENTMFRGLPHQPDGVHLTPEGYHQLAQSLLPEVVSALGR